MWAETPSGAGAANLITGMGGFLQAVIYGYGGIRLGLDQLEFNPPGHLPDQATKFIFHGIKYQGRVLDLIINKMMYEIRVNSQNNNDSIPIVYEYGEYRGLLKVNDHLSFPIGTHLIIRRSISVCPF